MPRVGKRPGAGRKASPHRATVQVRVTPEVWGRVEADCVRTGESQAEWVRQAVLERLERRLARQQEGERKEGERE
jgi:hypothetical protein